MILVDTSIWADHFRETIESLARLAAREKIIQHPFVTGELALGNAKNPSALIRSLSLMPGALVVSHEAVLAFVLKHQIGGTGIGYVDTHLLATCDAAGYKLWTRDKRLIVQAERLDLLYVAA